MLSDKKVDASENFLAGLIPTKDYIKLIYVIYSLLYLLIHNCEDKYFSQFLKSLNKYIRN